MISYGQKYMSLSKSHIWAIYLTVLDKLVTYFKERNKGALTWYGKLTWESGHAWNLIILCYLIV